MPNVTQPTWLCDYVDYIKNEVLSSDDIYKGENSNEDISSWSENDIWSHLKDKIYDSTITIVLISPNMIESGKWQRFQNGSCTSHRNAILAVILPDKNSSYERAFQVLCKR